MANMILSQDKKIIVSTEAIEFISTENALGKYSITAHTVGGTRITLGIYKSAETVEKVMCFIGFGATSESQKTIVIPPENLVVRTSHISVDPKFEKLLRDIIGGDNK